MDNKESDIKLYLPQTLPDASKVLGKVIQTTQETINQIDDIYRLWLNSKPSRRENKLINKWMDLYDITGSNVIFGMIRNRCIRTIARKGRGRADNLELLKTGIGINIFKGDKGKEGKK